MLQAQLVEIIQSEQLRAFIATHIEMDTSAYVFQKRNADFDIRTAFQQIDLLQRIKKKLPEWYAHQPILTRKLTEQCTSESVARYKSTLFSGKKMLDLTAGLGIDAFYIGKNFDTVSVCDADPINIAILKHNFGTLKFSKEIITYIKKAEGYFEKNEEHFDLIYIDPDRRDTNGKRSVMISDYSPDIMQLLPLLKAKAKVCAIKLSPMLDVTWLEKELQPSRIYSISERNEMKEILVVIEGKAHSPTQRVAVDVLNNQFVNSYAGCEMINVNVDAVYGTHTYFYEAGSALIKSGLNKQYFEANGIRVLNNNYTFGLMNNVMNNFMGRTFQLIESGNYSKRVFEKVIKEQSIDYANITTRNFPVSALELRKIHKLKDGGILTAFFSKALDGTLKYYLTKQLC